MKVHKDKKRRTIVIEDKWSESETTEALAHLQSVLLDLQRKCGSPNIVLRNFQINWNNLDEIDKLFRSIQGRRQQLKKEQGLLKKFSDSELYRIKWDSIQSIIDTDISFLYEDQDFDTEEKYYVYAHCDTSKKINVSSKNAIQVFAASLGMKYMPFYIGKGTGSRYKKGDRNRNYTKVSDKKFTDIDKVILKNNLTESKALQFESKLIDIFGLAIYNGFLINIDEGLERDHRRFCYQDSLKQLRNIENSL